MAEKAAATVAGYLTGLPKRRRSPVEAVRFRTADDLPLDAIGKLVADASVDAFIAQYEVSWK